MRQANQNNLYCPLNLFKNNYLFSVLRNHSGVVDNLTIGLFRFVLFYFIKKDINNKYIIKIKGGGKARTFWTTVVALTLESLVNLNSL